MKDIKGLVIHGWDLLRKPTTPVHVTYGLVCAFLCFAFGFWLGLVMIAGFAFWEMWNDRNEGIRQGPAYKEQGDWDFWESTIGFTIGLVVLAILQVVGIVSIGWL